MKIIHTISGLSASDGGPTRSVPSLASAQQRLGHEVQLCTTGTDDAPPPAYLAPDVVFNRFPRNWPKNLAFSRAAAGYLRNQPAEILHHHGLWHRPLHYVQLKARQDRIPLIVSPRGMMMPWAWNHHRRRKAFAARWVHPQAFAAVTGWHATSEEEADAIRSLGFRQPICIAPNGVDIPKADDLQNAAGYWRKHEPVLKDRRVALFYSRFHAKKRVIECIDLWLNTAPPDWLLLMVGVPDQFSVTDLERYVLRNGGQNRIRIFDGVGKPPPYAVAELFLLPSHSENFGMVVAEALAAGVPAVVTDGAPWEGLNSRHAGQWTTWADFGAATLRLLLESADSLRNRGENGRHWVAQDFAWSGSAAQLLRFYAGAHTLR